jgi:hypothetical protein
VTIYEVIHSGPTRFLYITRFCEQRSCRSRLLSYSRPLMRSLTHQELRQ